MGTYDGNLELQWINKDKSLLYEIDEEEGIGIKPTWVEKDDIRVSEPRILKLKGEYGDPNNENMLIKGDNLLALRTLVEEFKNRDEKDKVKCIYIDPPFNTGSAFEHYDDNLEHSQWLTMMKDRLILLKQLLREDGVIFLEIDDTEQAYLKVLLDEIFGRNNCILIIIVKRSATTGHKAINPSPVNVSEFIHIYAKNKINWKYIRQYVQREEYDYAYNQWVINIQEIYSNWKFIPLAEHIAKELGYSSSRDAKKELGKKGWNIKYVTYALNHPDNIIRFAQPNYSGVSQAAREMIDKSKEDISNIYLLQREDYSPMYFYKGNRILFLKDKIEDSTEGNSIVEPLTNMWFDIPWQGIAKEGNVTFQKSKKPEKMIKRILNMSTNDRDIVLDSFLGSGTTAAVAHKMGRRWIGIEIGKHAENLCIPRLRRVISGEDQSGISKEVNWQGGGGFRYYEVGESVIKDLDMNWDMTMDEMSRAVFMNFGFLKQKEKLVDGVFVGKSRKKGRFALCTVTKNIEIVRFEELMGWLKALKEKYGVWDEVDLYTNKGVGIRSDVLPDGVVLKKIPESLLAKYNL